MGNVDKEKQIVAEKGKVYNSAMRHTLQMIIRCETFSKFHCHWFVP